MNIREEAEKQYPTGDPVSLVKLAEQSAFVVGAMWARKETLREAAQVLRGEGEPGHGGEFVSVNHAQELILDLVEENETPELVVHRHPPHPIQTPYDF